VTSGKIEDLAVFRGPLPKRMSAEQFVDAVWSITGTAPDKIASGIPRGKPGEEMQLTAKWIWSDRSASSAAPEGETFTLGTEFDLEAMPASARAVFIADNDADIIVNGTQVVRQTGSDQAPQARSVEISNLKQGRNTILAVVRNGGQSPNPAGFIFEAHVKFAMGKPVVVKSDSTWQWTMARPDSGGRFSRPPRDWKPAEELLSPQVWDRFSQGLAAGLDPTMVRASLVPSDLLMRALGRPNREQIVSMRPDNITTLEAIDLANGELLAGLLKKGAAKLAKGDVPAETLVDSVYMLALGRRPSPQEKAGLVSTIGAKPSAQSIEDLLWLVLLLPEFQFVR
jgi:hypothetical protein